jgi:hypothetical protein
MRVVRGGHRWAAETVENAWWRAYTAPSCRSRIRELVSQLSQIGAAQRQSGRLTYCQILAFADVSLASTIARVDPRRTAISWGHLHRAHSICRTSRSSSVKSGESSPMSRSLSTTSGDLLTS